ncbi:hypothetical protein [Pseudonocardia sp. KRD291]|uniref:hypothetical protein n=1 Tax=Pseudonocardia sp. KRD291 TaxID=2792007 RepID=UPI001C4A1CA0|nr:hypothetical protein [Pseudonocardia sp. KRD291]MBW0103757.1 hypothetical protein [Pseudonocardia sp. KRD291]
MTSPVPRIADPALQSSVDHMLMQVDRDTVLKARAVLMQEAEELEEAMRRATRRTRSTPLPGRQGEPGCGVWVGRCSDDPVSGPAQISFNRKIDAVLEPCWRYIADLRTGGQQLAEAAEQYGYTETEVADSFRSTHGSPRDAVRPPS